MLETVLPEGFPELTSLGKRLEILRIERGISKQRLARHAGTSRQQLWRVMTGKSELTSSLRDRLAGALSVDPGFLSAPHALATTQTFSLASVAQPAATIVATGEAPSIALYLTEPAHLVATLRTLPSGDAGRRLKRALLNALEDLSVEGGHALPGDYSEIRRRVLSGEL
ncbi:MAG TPA: helix-turn-helix transcriptional regulator [Gemmatimonadaceae bacterium]|jgi:transcriptional regulator with XRE-family HTH domain|nr:helix-turn-helix transcriptional regulator [Gemmatimonadaceae bacterium]